MFKHILTSAVAFFLISCSSELPERPILTKGKVYNNNGDDDATPDREKDPAPADGTDEVETDTEIVDRDTPAEDKIEPPKDTAPFDPRAADLKLLSTWKKGEVNGSVSFTLSKIDLFELK